MWVLKTAWWILVVIVCVSSVRWGIAAEATVPRISLPSSAHQKGAPYFTGELRIPDDFSKSWFEWDHATGDWGGGRAWLLRHGIIPEIVYTVETFSKVHGGAADNAIKVLGNLDLSITVHTERAGLWKGGILFLYFESLVGQSDGINEQVSGLSANDALNPISSLNAPSFTHMNAHYYAQDLFEGLFVFKIGKQDANYDFVASDITGEFINGGISPPSQIPLPTFPAPTLGLAVFVNPLDWFSLKSGVYGGDLIIESFGDGGLFDGKIFFISQLDFKSTIGGYRGTYRGGAWFNTIETAEITPDPNPQTFDHNHGFYFLFDQQIYKERHARNDKEGLEAYFKLSWAPSDRNQMALWVGGGLMYTGLFPGRDADLLGFSVGNAELSSRLKAMGRTHESVLEWFYKAQLTHWLSLQPDIQYVINPAGKKPNALAIGLRMGISL